MKLYCSTLVAALLVVAFCQTSLGQQTQGFVQGAQQAQGFVQGAQQAQGFVQGAQTQSPTQVQGRQVFTPTQVQGQQPQGFVVQQPQTARVVVNPNAQLINELSNLMSQQARLGNTPNNNALLQGLQRLINQHHQAPTHPPTVPRDPLVGVTNLGPGLLKIGTSNNFLRPGFSTRVTVTSGTVPLTALNNQANIEIRHVGNGAAKFWDADDMKFTFLRPSDISPAKVNLGASKNGYRLEK